MTQPGHLSDDLLVRALDDELSPSERIEVDDHLSRCEECREKRQALAALSADLEFLVSATRIPGGSDGRERLIQQLDAARPKPALPGVRRFRDFRWAAGIAAAVFLALLIAPYWKRLSETRRDSAAAHQNVSSVFEVDGESFISLPYSNPDLPLTAPHIVQMQVPVASLAEAGILLEPVSTENSALDRSVLADVLLGLDGQPVGVHVLGMQ
jgi:anti-sigma factor RsiW